ncbi:hypothetical protein [Nocardia gipuzkoensis]
MPNSRTDTDTEHGLGWLRPTEPTQLPANSTATDTAERIGGSEWQWISQPAPHPAGNSDHARAPRKVWIWLAVGLAVATVLVGACLRRISDQPDMTAVLPTHTASPPPSARQAPSGACTGLPGQTVTDTAGDTHSLAGTIAAFEHAYYVQRSAQTALRLVAPEAGLALESLAAGIASIPIGTTHCVAITPIAETTAEVHVVERRPDGQRIDYLQLINTRRDHDHMVITNVQKRS